MTVKCKWWQRHDWKPGIHEIEYTEGRNTGGIRLLPRRWEIEERYCARCGKIEVRHIYRGFKGDLPPEYGSWKAFAKFWSSSSDEDGCRAAYLLTKDTASAKSPGRR